MIPQNPFSIIGILNLGYFTFQVIYLFYMIVSDGSSQGLKMEIPYLPVRFVGSGDLFAALLLAWSYRHPDDLKVSDKWLPFLALHNYVDNHFLMCSWIFEPITENTLHVENISLSLFLRIPRKSQNVFLVLVVIDISENE